MHLKKALTKFITNPIFISVITIAFFTYLLYPFVNVTKLEILYADSTTILQMISESTPWQENIYQWLDSRSGSPIFLISKAYFLFLGNNGVLTFVNILTALFLSIGFSIPFLFKERKLLFFPLGIFFVFSAIPLLPTQGSWMINGQQLMRIIVDLAHRPELLAFLNASILLSVKNFFENKTYYWSLTILVVIASWINDMSLFLFLTLCLFFTVFDFYKFRKVRIWYWIIFFIALSVVRFLKYLTPYPLHIYTLATFEQFKGNWVQAIKSLYEIFPKTFWIAMLLINIYFIVTYYWLRHSKIRQLKTADFYFRYWLILWILIIPSFIFPFFSDWFYANRVHPRYFATFLELLILASSISILGVLHISYLQKCKKLFFVHVSIFVIILLLILPIFFAFRTEIANKPYSLQYRSGELLALNCDGVIGKHDKSYVYVVGAFGRLKAGSYDHERSHTNFLHVLNVSNLCIVEGSEQDFSKEYLILDKKLKPKYSEEQPTKLPDGNYFKHYTVT